MVCEHCQKENRSIAKFCKYCGHPLVSQNILDRLVGLGDVKQQLKTVVDTYTYLHSRRDVMNVRLSVNTIIIGETGTGKTALAEVIRDYFHQYKIIPKPKLTMVDAVDYQRFVEKWDENVRDAKGGILFFDNVQKLLPDRYSNQVNPLDKLFVEMDKWDEDPIQAIRSCATSVRWNCVPNMVLLLSRRRQTISCCASFSIRLKSRMTHLAMHM